MALQALDFAANPSPAMKSEGKMGHNDGTHSPSNPMPKHPHILKRDGRYYYRRRIPSDLVEAKCYGKAKDIKKSLKTGDLATANRLAITVALEVNLDFEAKRREVAGFAKSAKPGEAPAKRRLADFSDIERRDFVIRQFIANEKLESAVRSFESDPDTRELKLEVAREDLGAIEGSNHYAGTDWLSVARKALEADGISIDATRDAATLRSIADMLRRAAMESAWRTERAISGSPFDARDAYFDAFHQDSPLPQAAKASKTVGDLRREFMADARERAKAGNLAPSTVKWMEQSSKVMAEFFGEETALPSITKNDAARLVAFLPTIPKNAAKRHRGVSVVTAAEREGKLDAKQLIQPKTVGYYFEGISSIFKFAVEWNWLSENPLVGRSIRERIPKVLRRHRQTMTPDEMAKVFSPDFIAQRSGKPGTLAARYWLPLLCLFHGTRANEVAGMRVADVMEADGIPFLNLCEREEHRLKNSNSERRVPLHRAIVELGFLEYAARRREQEPDGYLFPGLTRNKNGSMADAVCKWWCNHVRSIFGAAPADGPTGARGIHSLRHSWVAAARVANVAESTWKRLGGWSLPDASDNYGGHDALPYHKAAIDKIEFPKVDLAALRPAGGGQ
jgi:integrase